jgi:molybdopterin synthase sulfur carrier subunit
MQITVKLFALMREKVGTDTIYLELPNHADIIQALTVLQCQHPSLAPYLDNSRFALQMEFVSPETTLQAGDELALIPPVSGGISCSKSPQSH